ncbi:hypothetical protein TNCV_530111 [Trichonephila clavipes]|nr:hypothetical protein TNCV_530111 [Trichonephila clavipes]
MLHQFGSTGHLTCEITSMNIFLTDELNESRSATCHLLNGRSPDLSLCDLFQRGYVKDKVFVLLVLVDLMELKQRITTAIDGLDSNILTRVWAEMDNWLNVCPVTKDADYKTNESNSIVCNFWRLIIETEDIERKSDQRVVQEQRRTTTILYNGNATDSQLSRKLHTASGTEVSKSTIALRLQDEGLFAKSFVCFPHSLLHTEEPVQHGVKNNRQNGAGINRWSFCFLCD